ncbi:MAG TPA: DUF2339 domain-containing protein [Arenimonas sp.]|uniref:DUF2339 domain-containing protein n=1 Tax=Arenimonas sp. TaxID=1872635 RepID=UPI002D8028F8|nr:DUF2339 domain-containing protein [Arenimonas sp.]HEU0152365.1 DUF2339 domain-containing protein [Arenimonas sp.]
MSWILGIVGAFLGLFIADASREGFGLVAGALVGALLGMVVRARGRIGDLERRLDRVEALARRPAAAAAPAADAATAPPKPAPAPVPPDPEVAAGPVGPGGAPTPAVATPAAPPIPTDGLSGAPQPAAATPARATPPAIPGPGTPQPPPIPEADPAPWNLGAREPDVVEKAVAVVKGWLFEGNVPVKLGVLVLLFGVAAAIKYAADAGWLTMPIEFRLAGIAAGAIAGLVWGLRRAPEQPAFGLSLQGGAIGILLLVVFAAFRNYEVLGAMPAFVLVVILVAGASVLAVKQDAPALAVLGFIGGYLAPVLLSTGSGNHVALFSYYAVLNAAVFAIAWQRPWRALNLVGFVFTFVIGAMWGEKYYAPEKFATVEPFLILFFLFYVAIPVLYALAGRHRNGKVDGTLLFGTPLLAFPMQVGLIGDDRFGLAASAVFVAAVYTGLALWARRNQRLRDLAQSAAGMGVVFATLAIPLALTARWTSAAWALQGSGMVWLGLRQERRLVRWGGLALLVLAVLAWMVSLVDTHIDSADRFLANPHALNLGLLTLGWLFASWLYERAGKAQAVAVIYFLGGLAWWSLLGLCEIEVNLSPEFDALYYGGFALVTAVLAALLRAPLAWPRLSWPLAASVVLMLPLSLASQEHHTVTLFDAPLALWWAVLALALPTLAALRQPLSRGLLFAHLAWLVAVAAAAGLTLLRVLDERAGLADGWLLPAVLAPVALMFALAWTRPRLAGWPVADEFPRWRPAWLGLAGLTLGLGWVFGNFMPGDSRPLPWLPLLNPLELSLVLGLVVAAAWLRQHTDRDRLGSLAWAGAALFMLTMAVLRACHQLADLPWSASLLGETLAQTSLTVTWCLAGVTAWILGSRRLDRGLWWLGAGLLGVVLLKLLVVDRQFVGNIAGIVSFVVVGLLLIIVGRIAPTPPRSE